MPGLRLYNTSIAMQATFLRFVKMLRLFASDILVHHRPDRALAIRFVHTLTPGKDFIISRAGGAKIRESGAIRERTTLPQMLRPPSRRSDALMAYLANYN